MVTNLSDIAAQQSSFPMQAHMMNPMMPGGPEFDQSMGVQSAGQYMQQQMKMGQFPPQGQFLSAGANNPSLQNDPEMQKHMHELNMKFAKIKEDIEKTPNDINAFKSQPLPLARIKKIMKSDEDVRMISSEAPILFALACQMFITEITHKAAYYAKKQ